MTIINTADLHRYAEAGYNVLFSGKHGVGKTEIIKSTFDSMGYKWRYFSAATLDPWVDLIGVPKAQDLGRGEELTLVRPSFILDDDIDAIFFDELNRAPDKVLNAVMELIQFKSINGYKLNKLKVVWAAINPWDDENTYAVNEIDPAIKDRFQIQIAVPYKVDEDWFTAKYPQTGRTFCAWWRALEPELKDLISPRRLDVAADAHQRGLKLIDILPSKAGLKALKDALGAIPFLSRIEGLTSESKIKIFLSQINNVTDLLQLVKEQNPIAVNFLNKHKGLVPKEIVEAVTPAAVASSQKLNHANTEGAYEHLFRGKLEQAKHTFEVEAAAYFKADMLYQVELLTNPKFNILNVLLNELKLYSDASKAAKDRVHKLVGLALEYLSKAHMDPVLFNQHDRALIGLLCALIIHDGGEQFTRDRTAFLAGKFMKDGGANAQGIGYLLANRDASVVMT